MIDFSHTYCCALLVSFHIKYLAPTKGEIGGCYERSLYMFLALPDSILVRANRKDLEYAFGKENAGHGWIEIGDFVYDPTLQLRFSKSLYYQIFEPTNINKYTRKEYVSIGNNRKFVEDVCTTTLEDFKPGGRKRFDLTLIFPLQVTARLQGKIELLSQLDEYLKLVAYDENSFFKEMHDSTLQVLKEMRKK